MSRDSEKRYRLKDYKNKEECKKRDQMLFDSVFDLVIYSLISIFFPVFSIFSFISNDEVKQENFHYFLPYVLTLLFFFASFAYDFVVKYKTIGNNKKVKIFVIDYLFVASCMFCFLTFFVFVVLSVSIFNYYDYRLFYLLWNILQTATFASCFLLVYPYIELFIKLYQIHSEKRRCANDE